MAARLSNPNRPSMTLWGFVARIASRARPCTACGNRASGRSFRVRTAVRISREAAQAWRAEREAATDQRFGHKGEAA